MWQWNMKGPNKTNKASETLEMIFVFLRFTSLVSRETDDGTRIGDTNDLKNKIK